MMTLPKLLIKTQKVFNKYIRERDRERGCISCGSEVTEAGHYFSQGHHSSLRFDEVNVNGQCLRCNRFLHGNLINYRKGLVKRYGEEKIKRMETLVELRKAWKWSRMELEEIIKKYKTQKV